MRFFLAVMSAMGLLVIAMFGQVTMDHLSMELAYPFPALAGWVIGVGICAGYLLWYGLSALFNRPEIGLFITYLLVLVVLQAVFQVNIDFFDVGSALALLIHVGVTHFEGSKSASAEA